MINDGKKLAASAFLAGSSEQSRRIGEDECDPPMIDQAIQKHIGRKLKASYDDLVSQPVPDKFKQLLFDLENQEKKQ